MWQKNHLKKADKHYFGTVDPDGGTTSFTGDGKASVVRSVGTPLAGFESTPASLE